MIEIIQNKSVLESCISDETIIFTPSNETYKFKKNYLDKNVTITTLSLYLTKFLSLFENKTVISKSASIILMWKAYLSVKENLKKYHDINNVSFSKDLLKTYDFYLENEILDGPKKEDLKVIYEAYEKLVKENNFVTSHDASLFFCENIKKVKEDNFVFENIKTLSKDEIMVINALKESKNITIFANTINNKNLLDDLNKICIISSPKEPLNIFKNVSVTGTNDLYEETLFVRDEIVKDINSGLKFSDILVVGEGILKYESYFNLLFDFPHTKITKTGVLTEKFINLLKNVLNGDFSSKNFIDLLKLGVFNISNNDILELQNYIYKWDLFNVPFYDDFECYDAKDEAILDHIKNVKASIINPIKYLLDNVVKETNTKEILKYLCMYMDEEGIFEKLFHLDKEGYEALVINMELIHDLYKNDNVSNIMSLLSAMSNIKNNKESMQDEVKIIDLKDYYKNDYKKVYLLGMSDDNVLKAYNFDSLISKDDVSKTCLLKLIKANKDETLNNLSNVLLDSPAQISFYKLNEENKKVDKSNFLDAFDGMINYFNYNLKKETKEVLSESISKETAKKLYGDNLILSPSSLETYAKCKYMYFCNYGLSLNVLEKDTFDARKIGTFVHYILQNVISNDYEKNKEIDLEMLVNNYALKFFNERKAKLNNVTKYLVNNIKKSTIVVLKNVIKELDESSFNPKETELNIKDKPLLINLNHGTLKVKGIVDRVDYSKHDDNVFLRVIDYKTGSKSFRLDDFMEGLDLQMIIYLMALKDNKAENEKIIPAGFLYAPALVKVKKNDTLKDQLKMSGIIGLDAINSYASDKDYYDVFSKDDLNPYKVLNDAMMKLIFRATKNMLKKTGDDILNGDIKVYPIMDCERAHTCSYCNFATICKFNDKKDKYKTLQNRKNEEVIEMLEGEENGMDA